jgi:putative hydrolase of the HAD superfamily
MEPLPPPPLCPELEALVYPAFGGGPLEGIRGVLFDIYGTLFTSAAGDIGSYDSPRGSLDKLALEIGGAFTGEELKDYFRSAVIQIHRDLYAQTPYPEVRADEIWSAFLERPEVKTDIDPRELALRYELGVNPVYPMPGAGALLERLRKSGVILGIISNAQFFTPLLFDAFLGASPENLGFDSELLIYSYVLREAKPSPRLFMKALDRLGVLGIKPENCLYVGNDMLNDIFPAASLGFKTLLFAGDGRSLRLREGHPLAGNTRPWGIIRRLEDMPCLHRN